jgi:tetratricopeptide (TPR) repeat protein
MAYTAQGNGEKSQYHLNKLKASIQSLPADASLGLNKTADVLSIAEYLLAAKIALYLKKNNHQNAIDLFNKGIAAEDALNYTEPADWYIPVRESLGSALMYIGNAAEAEKVFRSDLEKNPRNGRSLFGLLESLKKQGKTIEAQFVQREFDTAWKSADIKLKIEEL